MKTLEYTIAVKNNILENDILWIEEHQITIEFAESKVVFEQRVINTTNLSIGFMDLHSFIVEYFLPEAWGGQDKLFLKNLESMVEHIKLDPDVTIRSGEVTFQLGFSSLDAALLFMNEYLDDVKRIVQDTTIQWRDILYHYAKSQKY